MGYSARCSTFHQNDTADRRYGLTDAQAGGEYRIRNVQQIAQIARYAETGHKDDREDHQPAAPALAADEHDDRGNDDTDEAASEPVQQTKSAEQKVSNEIRETKRQNQERKQVSERIQSRCNADLVRTEREARVKYSTTT